MTLTEAEIAALRDYAENGYPVNVTYRAGSGGHGFGDVGGLDPEDIRAVLAEIARLRKIEEAARALEAATRSQGPIREGIALGFLRIVLAPEAER